jgi:hypothetical protein
MKLNSESDPELFVTQQCAMRYYRVVGRIVGKPPVILFPGPLKHEEALRCKAALTPQPWRSDELEEITLKRPWGRRDNPNPNEMKATNKAGHAWNGETTREGETVWWHYYDDNGDTYESKEVPEYHIVMDRARIVVCEDGKPAIAPIL